MNIKRINKKYLITTQVILAITSFLYFAAQNGINSTAQTVDPDKPVINVVDGGQAEISSPIDFKGSSIHRLLLTFKSDSSACKAVQLVAPIPDRIDLLDEAREDGQCIKPYVFSNKYVFIVTAKSPLLPDTKLTFKVGEIEGTNKRGGCAKAKEDLESKLKRFTPIATQSINFNPSASTTAQVTQAMQSTTIPATTTTTTTSFIPGWYIFLAICAVVLCLAAVIVIDQIRRGKSQNNRNGRDRTNIAGGGFGQEGEINNEEFFQSKPRFSMRSVLRPLMELIRRPGEEAQANKESDAQTFQPKPHPHGQPTTNPTKQPLADLPKGGKRQVPPRSKVELHPTSGQSKVPQMIENILIRLDNLDERGESDRDIFVNHATHIDSLRDELTNLQQNLQFSIDSVKQGLNTNLQTKSSHLSDQIETHRKQMSKDQMEAIERLQAEIVAIQSNFQQQHDGLKRAFDQQRQDDFFARLLGSFVGRNISGLSEEQFSALLKEAGDNLNNFFKENIPRADVLQELRDRAGDIGAAFGLVAEAAVSIKSPAAATLRAHALSANNAASRLAGLQNQLAGLQDQLQNRQVKLDAKLVLPLQVPVSAHKNARDTFLEELGRAIKQEIDRLRDPVQYWERELERIVSDDAIKVVDICDLGIAQPGGHPEIEEALSVLFSNARLSPILPKAGTPFQASEHELIRLVSERSAGSQKIVRVIRRGFYHGEGNQKRLLRKATVEVSM